MLEYSAGSSTDRDDLYVELSFNRVSGVKSVYLKIDIL
ncbi:hypothetical protein J2Y91_001971 [Erwinia aphidicola]|nr:hypothetical protein [Erwinia aphidicola]